MPKRESQKHLEVLKDPDWSMYERATRTKGEAGKSGVPTLVQKGRGVGAGSAIRGYAPQR